MAQQPSSAEDQHPFAILMQRLKAPRISPESELQLLLDIMAALRDPTHGCPWDLKQTFETIAPYTIEEAYEVASAIERGDVSELKEELGDLLLQTVYHARIGEELGHFAFQDVAQSINEKLIRRHPHVFAAASENAANARPQWEEIKRQEREEKARLQSDTSQPGKLTLFDGIPSNLPALLRAEKMQKRAAQIGFDWPSLTPVFDKVKEEIAELEEALAQGFKENAEPDERAKQAQAEEFGDLLFVLVNLGRHLGIESEAALRAANAKFSRRLSVMHELAQAQGQDLEALNLDEMEELWRQAKVREGKP